MSQDELEMADMDKGVEQGLLETNGRTHVSFAIDEPIEPTQATRVGVQHRRRRRHQQNALKIAIVVLIPVLTLLALYVVISQISDSSSKDTIPGAAPTGLTYKSGFNMKNNWGSYSPYFDDGAKYEGIEQQVDRNEFGLPPGCSLSQVHVLHRHGERYPTGGIKTSMAAVAAKLEAMTESPSSTLSWLNNWKLAFGTDLLVPIGVATEFSSGARFWSTHGRLLYNATANPEDPQLFYDRNLNVFANGTQRPLPVLRTTTQSRIQTSARAWAAGFFGLHGNLAYTEDKTDVDEVYKLVMITEQPRFNNTLASYDACPNSDDWESQGGRVKQDKWVDVYLANAAARLQKLLPGYPEFGPQDAFQMQHLCAFETATYGSSSFCTLFTETEWRGYEYAADLKFHGDSSFGSPVGAAGGVGWLTELAARLEGRYLTEPQNGINVTLTNNPATFPLDQPFYMDMTHDSVIVSVLTAFGFDFLNIAMPDDYIPVPRNFIISRLTPFGARLYVEILECDSGRSVRLKLNDRILPLDSLHDCPASEEGLCGFDKFVSSVHKAIAKVDFDQVCYE